MDDVCEKRECVLVVINSPYLQLREREREREREWRGSCNDNKITLINKIRTIMLSFLSI